MKRLFVLRHAKSDWKAGDGDDHERPLNRRGEAAAKRMGRFLARLGQEPDRVVSSSAVRARSTAELAMAAGGWRCPLEVTRELYEVSTEALLTILRGRGDGDETLLFAGHEPTVSRFTSLLVGGGELRFPTGGLARVDLAVERWAEVTPGSGQLAWLVRPKILED